MVLGIIGGMGPMATAAIFKNIILKTNAQCDQEHLKILIFNNSSIPDRTENILNNSENPVEYLIESALLLQNAGANYLIMPCNTAHYYYDMILEKINIPFINMIEETVKYIITNYPNKKNIALLATEGTCEAGVYDIYMEKYGLIVLKPNHIQQKAVSKIIYDIKKGKEYPDVSNYNIVFKELKNIGADVFILGCTELSVLHQLYINKEEIIIDPMDIVSIRAIQFAGKKVRQIGSNIKTSYNEADAKIGKQDINIFYKKGSCEAY